jgi:hypothetical protein
MSVRSAGQDGITPLEESFLLAIGARNDFLHVYPDAAALLADNDIGAGVGEHPIPLEFFDSSGHRHVGRYDSQWHLLGLVPSSDPPDPERVLERVEAVRSYLRSFFESRPDVLALYGLTRDDMLAVFAAPESPRDLKAAVLPFAAGSDNDLFPAGLFGDDDDQGIWHNLTHHGHP